jgi:hypothetical protein
MMRSRLTIHGHCHRIPRWQDRKRMLACLSREDLDNIMQDHKGED